MPRGPSAKMNFFPGLSPTSRQAPFVALFDVLSFKEALDSAPPFNSSENSLQSGANISDSPDCHGENYTVDSGSSIESGVQHESNSKAMNSSDTCETLSRNLQEAYWLVGQKAGEAPGITIFCAGPSEDLEDLILSTLYHRLAWGIQDPLLGFAWDRTSTFISVIFGCVGPCPNEDDCLVCSPFNSFLQFVWLLTCYTVSLKSILLVPRETVSLVASIWQILGVWYSWLSS